MHNTVLLRRLTDALALTDDQLAEAFALGGHPLTAEDLGERLRTEGARGFSDQGLGRFLDGLILVRRGPPNGGTKPRPPLRKLTNNDVLKKLRIALDLKEPELLALLESGGVTLDSRELTPFFRRKGQSNYKACGDEVLEALFDGIAASTD